MFTGYIAAREERAALYNQCLRINIKDAVELPEYIPPTRNIKDTIHQRKYDPSNPVTYIASATGHAMAHAAEVCFFLRTGFWKQFNAVWSYKRGQYISGIRGDNGSTINGVLTGARTNGLLPCDPDEDGIDEYPNPESYTHNFSTECYDIASKHKLGYSLFLEDFDSILYFLQSNQGAVIVGGPHENWKCDDNFICHSYVSGGNSHVRCYVDWITMNGVTFLIECDYFYGPYDNRGFKYHSRNFVNSQCRDRYVSCVGISDMPLPQYRVIEQFNTPPSASASRKSRSRKPAVKIGFDETLDIITSQKDSEDTGTGTVSEI